MSPTPITRPDPIALAMGGKALATAYASRCPTGRSTCWSWRMRFRDPLSGDWRWSQLGRLAAEDVPSALLKAYREIDPSAIKEDGQHIETVGDVLRAWVAWIDSRGPDGALRPDNQLAARTVLSYRGSAKRLLPRVARLQVGTLTRANLEQIRDALLETGAKRTTNADMKALHQAVRFARGRGIEIPDLEWRGLNIKVSRKEHVHNHHTPSHGDVEALYSGMRRSRLKLGLYIGWVTGARPGEVAALRPTDLVEDDDGPWVCFPSGKTGPRRFPVSAEQLAEIRDQLGDWPADRPMLPGEQWVRNSSGRLTEACRLRGIEPFTMHGLRRLMCDTCQRQGVDLGTYMEILGHSADTALEHYRQPTVDDLRGVVPKLASRSGVHLGRWLADRGMTEADAIRLLERGLKAGLAIEEVTDPREGAAPPA